MIAHKIAAKNGVRIDALPVDVEAAFDRRGVTLAEEVAVPFPDITLRIDVTTDAGESAIEGLGRDLVWFGIVTVVGAEIGLLTPPLGLSCYAIKSIIDDPDISLFDIFYGAFPFAVVMLLVLILIIAFPAISLILV